MTAHQFKLTRFHVPVLEVDDVDRKDEDGGQVEDVKDEADRPRDPTSKCQLF